MAINVSIQQHQVKIRNVIKMDKNIYSELKIKSIFIYCPAIPIFITLERVFG